MQLRRFLSAALLLIAGSASAQTDPGGSFDADFLLSYYDQDGDHSPVTGGEGTEALQVVSPIVVLAWRVNEKWTLAADLGIDQISSASIGNIQQEVPVSGASIPGSDTRTFGVFKAKRKLGQHTIGLQVGAANEYDYSSFNYGVDWSVELNQANTALTALLRRYDDKVDLVGIDGFGSQGDGLGFTEGQADRTTTDAMVAVSQVFGRRTVGSLELFYSMQKGFLSTAYHEVILVPDPPLYPDGKHVAERLPDSRDRKSIGLRVNHAFTDDIVQRVGYRYYDDDWGINAHTIELETHFRLPVNHEMWVYPIIRYHTQTAAYYFGLPRTFTGNEDYYTSDYDLSDISTQKYGVGWTVMTLPNEHWFLRADRFEVRGTVYDRDDGLSGFTTSFAMGWTFW